MKSVFPLLVMSLPLVFSGCDQSKSTGNGVAIVDLDLIAQRLGRDAKMKESIEQRQLNLNQQIVTVQNSFLEQLKTKQSEFGETPTESQTQMLTAMQREANLKLNSVRQQAQGNMSQFQQSVINQFREEAKPIAEKLAAEKGCKIVLTKNDTVIFAFDSVVDITEDMITRMKQSSKTATPTTPAPQTASSSAPKVQTAANPAPSTKK